MLLDIQLPELDGFEILDAMPANQLPAIVFVTAYDRFAVKAFEVHAVDYLLKPVEADRLNDALNRVRTQRLEGFDSHIRMLEFMRTIHAHRALPNRILLKSENEIICLKPSEIDWVESAGNYACFHVGSQTRISRETMHAVQGLLEKHNFVRIHRSAIVNLDRVRRLKPLLYGDHEIELRDGTKLPMSRTHRQAVIKRLESL